MTFAPERAPRRARPSRRLLVQGLTVLVIVGLAAWLAPDLGAVRDRLAHAVPAWVLAAVGLELLSCLSYVLMVRRVFCRHLSWRTTYEIGMASQCVGSLLPASGAGGVAFGAWALSRDGMSGEDLARRSVAFLLLKGAPNVVAVAVLGVAMWIGVGPALSPTLTVVPAALALLVLAVVVLASLLVGRWDAPSPDAGRTRRALALAARSLHDGMHDALALVRARDWVLIAGSLGYWVFDNAVLWAALHAFGESPPLTIVLMGYLLGQMGGLLPIPGGIGGVDGGLVGTLALYGLPAVGATAAVVVYRLIVFWLTVLLGGIAVLTLRRGRGAGPGTALGARRARWV